MIDVTATHYTITGVYAGAVDVDRNVTSPSHARAIAGDLIRTYKKSAEHDGESWQVYVQSHYCGDDPEDECVCGQYETDHHPYASSDGD